MNDRLEPIAEADAPASTEPSLVQDYVGPLTSLPPAPPANAQIIAASTSRLPVPGALPAIRPSTPDPWLAAWTTRAARFGAVAAGSLLALYTSGRPSACLSVFYLGISVASFIACAVAFSYSRPEPNSESTVVMSIMGMVLSSITLLVALLFLLRIL